MVGKVAWTGDTSQGFGKGLCKTRHLALPLSTPDSALQALGWRLKGHHVPQEWQLNISLQENSQMGTICLRIFETHANALPEQLICCGRNIAGQVVAVRWPHTWDQEWDVRSKIKCDFVGSKKYRHLCPAAHPAAHSAAECHTGCRTTVYWHKTKQLHLLLFFWLHEMQRWDVLNSICKYKTMFFFAVLGMVVHQDNEKGKMKTSRKLC